MFPFGNNNQDTPSIYLDFVDPKGAPAGWHSCVQFALVMWNPEDPTQYVFQDTFYRFTANKNNPGFRFYNLDKLFTPSETRTRALIENNSTNITAFVRVLKDPTGDLWLNLDNDSRNKNHDAIYEYDTGKTKDSFIFSFKNKNNFKDPILSHVEDMNEAIYYCNEFGPTFSTDLVLFTNGSDTEYNHNFCRQFSYEKKIRETEDDFLIEDYEVFQIIKDES